MIKRNKHLVALIGKHYKELVKGNGGIWIDGYNNSINTQVAGTITTRVDAANMLFITERRNGTNDVRQDNSGSQS